MSSTICGSDTEHKAQKRSGIFENARCSQQRAKAKGITYEPDFTQLDEDLEAAYEKLQELKVSTATKMALNRFFRCDASELF